MDIAGTLQLLPSPGALLTFVSTYLVLFLLFAATAHIAARYVLGRAPIGGSALVGGVLAGVTLLLRGLPTVALVLAALLAEVLAVRAAYDTGVRGTAAIAALHVAITFLLSVAVRNAVGLL